MPNEWTKRPKCTVAVAADTVAVPRLVKEMLGRKQPAVSRPHLSYLRNPFVMAR